MKRKCEECKKTIVFDKNSCDTIIKFKSSCYHYDCFIKACERKSKRSNASPIWSEALNSIDELKEKSKNHFLREIYKDDIFEFIKENYDIKVVPPKIFTKLSDIYNGTYRGLTCCIPPEDILDMWKQKMNYLNKVRAKNITLGKEMDVAQQINYDISVLLNKYDSYLKWKEQNKIIEQDVNKVHKDILKSVDLDKLSKIAQNHEQEDEDDIDSLLDEIFD